MLGYRNIPAGPRMLRPWMTCLAWSWPQLVGGYGCPAATRTVGFAEPVGFVVATGLRRRGPNSVSDPGQPLARPFRPKPFIYHFAAEVLLALIESLVHELPD